MAGIGLPSECKTYTLTQLEGPPTRLTEAAAAAKCVNPGTLLTDGSVDVMGVGLSACSGLPVSRVGSTPVRSHTQSANPLARTALGARI